MKHLHLPSGLRSGVGLLIDKNWTTEQVVAVVDLLDDLREVIVRHYEPQLQEHSRRDQGSLLHPCVTPYGEAEPF